jgi:hypothetical protein
MDNAMRGVIVTKIHGDGVIRSTYEVTVTAQAYAHGGRIPQGIPQAIQDVLNHGAAKCKAGWENIPIEEHIAHAITDLADHAIGNNTGEPRLRHALTRCMMAVAINEEMVEVTKRPEAATDGAVPIALHRRFISSIDRTINRLLARPGKEAEEFDEARAYQYADQVLHNTEKMGIEPHHAQELADRIVDALRGWEDGR